MSADVAIFMFLLYCFMTGLTLSVIFIAYTMTSIASIFFISAGMFAAMSVYGMVTKQDLSKLGQILIMALFGIIIAGIVNIFFGNQMVDLITSIIGVIIFTGLTAYDTQKIKNMSLAVTDDESKTKVAILGALNLYLDFINLFLELLRLF